jgi:hypothetical protein
MIHADLADIIEVEVGGVTHFFEQPRELPSGFIREDLPDYVLLLLHVVMVILQFR